MSDWEGPGETGRARGRELDRGEAESAALAGGDVAVGADDRADENGSRDVADDIFAAEEAALELCLLHVDRLAVAGARRRLNGSLRRKVAAGEDEQTCGVGVPGRGEVAVVTRGVDAELLAVLHA